MERKQKELEKKNERQTCARCGGLLITDLCMEILSGADQKLAAQRCVQCGEVLDPVIVRNRQSHYESAGLSPMNIQPIIHLCILAAVLAVTGCATDVFYSANEQPALKPVNVVGHEQARELAFTYRRQAADLYELAHRMEYEARYSGQLGAGHEESTRRRLQAKNVLSAAEDADKLARAYQRQVPHGQMQ